MAFESFSFLILALASVALLRICRSELTRSVVLCAASAVFVASFVDRPLQLLPLLAFVAMGYVAIILANKLGRGSLVVLIGMTVVLFAWLKQYTVIAELPRLAFVYSVVGLSYLLFRILHLIIAAAQNQIRVPGVLSYLNYTLSFLTLVAGPVQRYRDFSEQMRQPPVPATQEELIGSLGRVTRGYFYLLVLGEFARMKAGDLKIAFYTDYAYSAWVGASLNMAAAALVYFVFLYINFSGYMHVVVGLGRLSGFALPENFDRPYKAVNFLDFWARWHITVSEWLRTYLFNPLLKALMTRWGGSVSGNLLAVIAFFVTFFVMGMWHGTTVQFLVCGLLLAVGVTVNKVCQSEIVHRIGRPRYRALCKRPWYVHFSRAATLAFMAIALVCVWAVPELSASGAELVPMPRFLSPPGLLCSLGAFIVLLLVIWGLGPVVQSLVAMASRLFDRFSFHVRGVSPLSRPTAALAWAAAKVFAIAVLAVVLNWSPVVVYKGF